MEPTSVDEEPSWNDEQHLDSANNKVCTAPILGQNIAGGLEGVDLK